MSTDDQSPPAYDGTTSDSTVRYPHDIKPGQHNINTQAYAVEGAASQGLYPNATEHYVPPTAEPASHNDTRYEMASANVPTAPPVASLPVQSGYQQNQYPNQYQQQQIQHQQPQYQQQGAQLQNMVPGTVFIGEPVTFHIYRQGWVSRDCRILQSDKKTVAYHIDYPRSFFGSWHVNMRRSGANGPTVFLITKSAMGSDFTIQDPVNPALTTKVVRSGGVIGKRKHAFAAFDGKQYAWKGAGLGGDLKLVCYPLKTVAAFYHRKKHAWAKEGRLEILPGGQHILDLVVATGFCVEEWERQNH
ncbi:hypothetical protein DFJ77DRAFT_513484 [Powellomyces hirtus]|nr:hypothetical protein DFJ77DRAFT_513484 [Powellomyces hirtus]